MVSDRFIKEVSARSSSISIFSFKERVYLFEWRLCNLNFSFILQDFFLQDFSSCSFKVEFFQYPDGSRLSLLHVVMLKDLVWLVLVSQHISTGHLVCTANKKTDCYRKYDTGLKRVRRSFTDSFRQFWSLTMNFITMNALFDHSKTMSPENQFLLSCSSLCRSLSRSL